MIRLIILGILFLLLAMPVLAQDDIIQAEYDAVSTVSFDAPGGQAFLQFTGSEGDVVYVLAGEAEIAFGTDLTLDLRDSVGRSIGMNEEYAFQPFIVAELPSDGHYVVVVTFEHDEAMDVEVLIGQTQSIGSEEITITFGGDNFAQLLVLDFEESGMYLLQMGTSDNQILPTLVVANFSEFITERTVYVGGSELIAWGVGSNLNINGEYVVFITNEFGLFHVTNGFEEVEIELSLKPIPGDN